MDVRTMSGLELIQALADGTLPRASMAQTMGMGDIAVTFGSASIQVCADRDHLNPYGGVHGGFAATVLDSVTAFAVQTTLPAGVGLSTVDLNVKMLKSVPMSEPLFAEGRVTHVSFSLGFAEGTLKDGAGNLLASASITCYIKRPKS